LLEYSAGLPATQSGTTGVLAQELSRNRQVKIIIGLIIFS
jgi:hypothetical protein